MTAVTELGYAVLGVKDVARWRHFACDFLGLEGVDGETSKRVYLRMDFWHHRMILQEDASNDVLALGFRVAGSEEFGALFKKLKDNNVDVRVCSDDEAAERRVLQLMKLEDSLGNPLEIFEGPFVQFNKPFHPGRRMYGKFDTGAGGLGHCMMHGDRIQDAHRFYSMLGLRGGVEYRVETAPGKRDQLLFMHCNQRDHSIAFGFPGKKRINHLLVESTEFDDVAYTYSLAKEMQVPIAVELGRHSNDHAVSFYCMSPAGFLMEYGWGSRSATHQSEFYDSDFYGHQYQHDVVDADWNTVE